MINITCVRLKVQGILRLKGDFFFCSDLPCFTIALQQHDLLILTTTYREDVTHFCPVLCGQLLSIGFQHDLSTAFQVHVHKRKRNKLHILLNTMLSRGKILSLLLLLLLVCPSCLLAKPYASYGFYSPYPPPPDQILYEFSPLEDRRQQHRSQGKSRETRDLADFDAVILDPAREPTCAELKNMWRLAQEMHQRALSTNEVPKGSSLVSFAPLPTEQEEKGSRILSSEVVDGEVENSSPSSLNGNHQPNRRRMSSAPPITRTRGDDYEVKLTSTASKSAPQVRDPAREIYGLLRERTAAAAKYDQSSSHAPVYGDMRTHQPSSSPSSNPSYFELLHSQLLEDKGLETGQDGDDEPSYGTVRYAEPEEPATPALSSLDRVRLMVSEARNEQQRYNNNVADDDDDGVAEDAFDLIRQRLMNTRLGSNRGQRMLSRSRTLRRKDSKKRRRNVSCTQAPTFIQPTLLYFFSMPFLYHMRVHH